MVTSKSQFKGSNGNELRGTLHKENMRVARSLLALEQLLPRESRHIPILLEPQKLDHHWWP